MVLMETTPGVLSRRREWREDRQYLGQPLARPRIEFRGTLTGSLHSAAFSAKGWRPFATHPGLEIYPCAPFFVA